MVSPLPLEQSGDPEEPSTGDADRSDPARGRAPGLAVLAVCTGVFALLVNSVLIDRPGPWRDEAATWESLDRSLGDLLATLTRVDLVHGFYYLVVRLWAFVCGDSIVSLRWSSVASIAVTAGLVVLLGGCLFGRSAGLWAGLVFCVLPQATWAATEARSFAVSCVAVTGLVLAFFRAVAVPNLTRWLAFAVVAVLAVHLFLYSIAILILLAIGATTMRPGVRRPALLATAGAALACVPLAVSAAGQRQQVAWLAMVRPTPVGSTVAVMWGANPWAQAAGAVIIVAVIVLTLRIMRREPELRTNLTLIWGWLVVPSVALLAAGAWVPLYHPRYVTFSAPALAILLGLVISRARRGHTRAAVFVAIVAVSLPQFVASREPLSKATPAPAVDHIAQRMHPGDCLYVPWRDVNALQWAFPRLGGLTNVGHPPRGWRRTSLYEPTVSVSQLGGRLNQRDRLWVVADGARIDEGVFPALAARGYRVAEDVRFADDYRTRVILFEPAGRP